ncbi:MAG TPA: hypothetical protein VFU05_12460 [Cyclobacteriaceae bacterium]|nr:hypothetical protein [Cyclobacteriaceae bacterium]
MKIYIIVFLIFISTAADAQEIIYEFPKSVIDKVQEHISHYSDTSKFIALFHVEDDGKYSLTIMKDDFTKDPNFKDITDVLVNKTTRFVKINNVKMPMITGEDFIFADFGTVYFPESKSEKRRVGKKRPMFITEDWSITFDKTGRIYTN